MVVFGCGNSGPGKGSPTIVNINGENVSVEHLNRYMSKKPTVRVNTASGVVEAQVAEPLDFQALQDLIGQKVIMQLAKDEGVSPTDADVLKELEFRKKLNPQYVQELTQNGITFEIIKENLALELAREMLLTKGITVTPEETEKYIKDNPAQFTEKATADLFWVFVKGESKKPVVDKEIQSGQTFSAVAVKLSEFPTAREQGGRFPRRVLDEMPPALKELVGKTAVGKTTDWLKLEDGWAKFYVQNKTAAKLMTLDADKKEVVRRQIARMRGEQATDLPKRVLEKIKASTINVNDPNLRGAWEKAYKRLQEEGNAAGGAGTPPAGAATPGGTTGGAPAGEGQPK